MRGDYTGLPILGQRCGMKVVKAEYQRKTNWDTNSEHFGTSHWSGYEVITHAYGNGYFCPKPDELSDEEFENIKRLAKACETCA